MYWFSGFPWIISLFEILKLTMKLLSKKCLTLLKFQANLWKMNTIDRHKLEYVCKLKYMYL